LVIAVISLFVLCVAGRLFTIQGLITPVRIGGGSMAETLCGAHFVLSCDDCRFPCRYDAAYPPTDERVVCPNCGFANRRLEEAIRRPGERVLIDGLVYSARSPNRWEIVAFRTPGAEENLAVKRVVGLPGENVSVRHGDVYINGSIQAKSLEQLRDMAILVHDDASRPRKGSDLPRRWQAESAGSGWHRRHGIIAFEPRSNGCDDLDWITYRHWRCAPSPAPRTEEYAVLDDYGYNQQISRQLQRIADLMLVCRLRSTWDAGSLAFSIQDGRDRFQVVLLPARNEGRLHRNDSFLEAVKLPAAAYARDVKIELALLDHRILFAIDQQVLIEREYQPATGPSEPASRPLAIGAIGLSMTIRRLQVYRDLYYLHPNRVGWNWSAVRPLGADEYFVLGDNVPLSEDSRHWTEPGLPRKLLLGKVLRGL